MAGGQAEKGEASVLEELRRAVIARLGRAVDDAELIRALQIVLERLGSSTVAGQAEPPTGAGPKGTRG